MASTWSALKIELLETGQNSGTWGTATNVNLGDAILGEAITGQATVDFATDADVTITLTDSATSQAARNLRLNITESSTGVGSVRNLILGSGCQIEKFYLINNTGTGAKTIKNTSGTGISVPAGKATLVYNNGTNVVDAASYFSSLTLGSALPVASGGTGLTAGTSGGVLAYTATGTLASSTALAASALVIGGGAGAAPSTTTTGTGVVTALGVNTGSAGAFVVNGGALGSPSSVGTMPAFTLGGTIAGGGNQINNVIIGTSTPLAGAFTTVTASTAIGTASGGTGLGGATPFTSGGVVYASSASVLATGSALTFDGSNLSTTGQVLLENNKYIGFKNTTGTYAASIFNDTSNFLNFYNSGNTGTIFYVNAAEQMRLTSSGLALGTTSATAKLTVINTADANKQIVFGDSATYYGSVGHNSGSGLNEYRTEPSGGHGFFIGTSGTANMTLNSSGDLLVGTTTQIGSNLLTLQDSGGDMIGMRHPSATAGLYWTHIVGTDNKLYILNASSTGVSIANGDTSWAAFSDERSKDIIEPITDATNKVSTLRSVIGKYKTDSEGTRRSFLIAQDVQAVLPEAVDASNPDELSLRYSEVIPLLVAAIKEQTAIIESLKARLDAANL